MARAARVPMWPMAEACEGMTDKPLCGPAMTAPGIAFTAPGVAIVLRPSVPPRPVAARLARPGG